MKSLLTASMICETAVGVIRKLPCAKPRNAAKAADAHNARGKRLDTVGGVRVIEKRRALFVAEPHDDKREDTER